MKRTLSAFIVIALLTATLTACTVKNDDKNVQFNQMETRPQVDDTSQVVENAVEIPVELNKGENTPNITNIISLTLDSNGVNDDAVQLIEHMPEDKNYAELVEVVVTLGGGRVLTKSYEGFWYSSITHADLRGSGTQELILSLYYFGSNYSAMDCHVLGIEDGELVEVLTVLNNPLEEHNYNKTVFIIPQPEDNFELDDNGYANVCTGVSIINFNGSVALKIQHLIPYTILKWDGLAWAIAEQGVVLESDTQAKLSIENDSVLSGNGSQSEFPVEYADILNSYSNFINGGYIAEYEEHNESISFGTGLFLAVLTASERICFGYGLKDINGDGKQDLFLMSKSLSENNEDVITVYEIYSLHAAKPILLREFWDRSLCMLIADDGTIYHSGSGGASTAYYSTHQIAHDGGSLITINSIRVEFEPNDVTRYYKYDDKEQEIEINAQEGIELYNMVFVKWVNNSAPGISFIPLFD